MMAFELLSIVKHKQPSLSKYPVGGLRVLGVIFLAHPRLKQLGLGTVLRGALETDKVWIHI